MTIIEREIERRERLMVEKSKKEACVRELQQEIERLNAEIERLNADIENTDIAALQAEIDELKTYLPPDPEATADEPAFCI